jgi:hypothetical protein
MRSVTIFIHQKISTDHMKQDVMHMAHGTYGGGEKCIQIFGGEKRRMVATLNTKA